MGVLFSYEEIRPTTKPTHEKGEKRIQKVKWFQVLC